MSIPTGQKIEFAGTKELKFIKSLGQGGTGDTHLFEDETTDMLFAIKKYAPKDLNYLDEFYSRFVDEIKILFKISHPNIVRIYNYYLYSEFKTGYLQMEYIDGVTIDKYNPNSFLNKSWDEIFTEVIGAFEYLELKGILHRDIRPANIMIDNDDNVKIIDFGFGKKLESTEQDGRSVVLNWPVTQLPYETETESIYNHQTEIYFVGKLFSHILKDELPNFKFVHIINKMTELHPNNRYQSFNAISTEIAKGIIGELNFNSREKDIYIKFADNLTSLLSRYHEKYQPLQDLDLSLNRLGTLIRNSSLEKFIQDKGQLIRCFIGGKFSYYQHIEIEVKTVIEFYKLLQQLHPNKRKIVFDNLYTRLATIKIDYDDLPF